jgi:aspartate oxidase
MRNRRPVVVVGGGVAGLVTALAAAPTPVRLLCRTHDGSGTASTLAQGGIAAALDPADSPAEHVRDTLTAGAQHNDAAMVRWLCAEAPAAIRWLAAQGVVFDRDATRGRRARRQCTLDRAWRIAGTAELSVLRELLWQAAGRVRQAAAMRRTLDAVEALAAAGWQARLARQLLLAALRRPLSLGAHHRCDTVVPA